MVNAWIKLSFAISAAAVSAVGVYYLRKKPSEEEVEERKVIPSTDESGMKEEEADNGVSPSEECFEVEEDEVTKVSTKQSGDYKEDDVVVIPLSKATVDKDVPEDMTNKLQIAGSGMHKEDDVLVSGPLIEAIVVKEADVNEIIPTDDSGSHKEDDAVVTPLSESNVDEQSEENVAKIQLSIEDIFRKHPEMTKYMCWGSFLDKPAVKDSNNKDCEVELTAEKTKAEAAKVVPAEKDAGPGRMLPEAVEQEKVERATLGIKSVTNSATRKPAKGIASVVAQHYNGLQDKGLVDRDNCKISQLRKFNNHIKSGIIETAIRRIRREKGYGCSINVLDLCCGKGGDLLKWNRERVNHVIFADIAEKSIEECVNRYTKMNSTRKWFTTEFIVADCTAVRIKNQFNDPDMPVHLVSNQFAVHYSFESQSQAENMLANVADNLAPGGYFIGTTTDTDEIMKRLRRDQDPHNRVFGNSIFSVEFPLDTPLDPPPPFGAKYNFKLEGAVDCPEFLVDFRTFEKLAAKYGLKLVRKCRFEDAIAEEKIEGNDVLSIYKLSKEELEAACLYLYYVFRKEV